MKASPLHASPRQASSLERAAPPEAALRGRWLRPVHGLLNVSYVLAAHGALLGWLWFGRGWMPLPVYLGTAILASVMHQRLLSEWFHEATHWNFVPNRRWNDLLADLLMGPWNGSRVRSNRIGHFRHHAVAGYFTQDDPDTARAAAGSRRELLAGLLRDLTGFHALQAYLRRSGGGQGSGGPAADPPWLLGLILLHGAGFAASIAAGRPELYPIYFGSLLCLYPVVDRVRLYGQHAGLGPGGQVQLNGSPVSRTVHAGWLEQCLLNGPVIMYHHEHHAWPNLPYRALRALRALAKESGDPNVTAGSGFRVAVAVLTGLPR